MEEQYTQNTQPTPPANQNGMAIAGMVLGICAVFFAIFFWFLWFISIILGVVGLVLSISARKQNLTGMATAGLVLNIVALAFSVVLVLACTACLAPVSLIR